MTSSCSVSFLSSRVSSCAKRRASSRLELSRSRSAGAVQDVGGHDHPVFGEGVGWKARVAVLLGTGRKLRPGSALRLRPPRGERENHRENARRCANCRDTVATIELVALRCASAAQRAATLEQRFR